MQYGFKFQQKKEKADVLIAEQAEVPYEGNCVCCGEHTTYVLECESDLTVFVPVCTAHVNAVKVLETPIETMVEAIKLFIKGVTV